MSTRTIAGTAVASVLGADCLMHLFWAVTGSPWPAASHRALSAGLLNAQVPFSPPVLLPLAALLLGAALLVSARAGLLGRLGRLLPTGLGTAGVLVLAAGLAVRAAAGLVWIATAERGTPFWWLNLFAYTPACLGLVAACAVVLRPGRPGPDTVAG